MRKRSVTNNHNYVVLSNIGKQDLVRNELADPITLAIASSVAL